MKPRPENAAHLVNEAVAVHEPMAQQKGIRLTAECDALDAVEHDDDDSGKRWEHRCNKTNRSVGG